MSAILPGDQQLSSAHSGTQAQPAQAAGGSRKMILVVDDEVIVRMLIAELLEDAGYAVAEAHDGPSALAQVEGGLPADLLVSDIGLPGGMNGRQLAAKVLERRPGIGVLFVTGYANMQDKQDAAIPAPTQIIGKPFASDDLLRRVAELLASPPA